MTTTEFDMNESLKDAIYEAGLPCTIIDYGMMTNNTGMVIKNTDGSEFCVTITQVA